MTADLVVVELTDPDERARACSGLLRSLPDWFGLEESIVAYERDVRALPTFAVRDGDGTAAFLSLKLHNEFSAEVVVMAVRRVHPDPEANVICDPTAVVNPLTATRLMMSRLSSSVSLAKSPGAVSCST